MYLLYKFSAAFQRRVHLVELFLQLLLVLGKFPVQHFLNDLQEDFFLSVFLCLNKLHLSPEPQHGALELVGLVFQISQGQNVGRLDISALH